jgi:hypothetical protein
MQFGPAMAKSEKAFVTSFCWSRKNSRLGVKPDSVGEVTDILRLKGYNAVVEVKRQ